MTKIEACREALRRSHATASVIANTYKPEFPKPEDADLELSPLEEPVWIAFFQLLWQAKVAEMSLKNSKNN